MGSLDDRMALTSGITRLSSSSSEQGSEPGRVDIPPMSRIAGGSGPFNSFSQAVSAYSTFVLAGSPSENESGVVLKMAMMYGEAGMESLRGEA